jgi:hypothetical protein
MKREKINSRSGAQSLGRIFYKKDKKDLCSTLTATASVCLIIILQPTPSSQNFC